LPKTVAYNWSAYNLSCTGKSSTPATHLPAYNLSWTCRRWVARLIYTVQLKLQAILPAQFWLLDKSINSIKPTIIHVKHVETLRQQIANWLEN
jgi:hypothetical protein